LPALFRGDFKGFFIQLLLDGFLILPIFVQYYRALEKASEVVPYEQLVDWKSFLPFECPKGWAHLNTLNKLIEEGTFRVVQCRSKCNTELAESILEVMRETLLEAQSNSGELRSRERGANACALPSSWIA